MARDRVRTFPPRRTQILTGTLVNNLAASYGVAAVDIEGNGFVDLFLATFDPQARSHCFLYRNSHDSTFTSVTDNVLVTDLASSVRCAFA